MFGRNKGGTIATPKGTSGYNYETVMIHKEGSSNDIFEELNEQIRNRPGVKLSHMLPVCLLYTSPSPRDATLSRMPSSA